jgi:anti-sigma factor RsiW
MKCSRIKKKLSVYLDGEMPEQERIVISEHLQRCEECKAELAGLMKVADSLNILDGVDVPPYFMTRLRQYIKEEAKPVSFLQRIRGVAISAATALAVIVSLFIGNQAGRTLYQSIAQTPEPAMAETNDVFGLSTFEEFPDGSLSDIYNELVTGGNNG